LARQASLGTTSGGSCAVLEVRSPRLGNRQGGQISRQSSGGLGLQRPVAIERQIPLPVLLTLIRRHTTLRAPGLVKPKDPLSARIGRARDEVRCPLLTIQGERVRVAGATSVGDRRRAGSGRILTYP